MAASPASSPNGPPQIPVVDVNSSVSLALGLGWQMAWLYYETDADEVGPPELPDRLPGLSALSLQETLRLRFAQILLTIERLKTITAETSVTLDPAKRIALDALGDIGPPAGAASPRDEGLLAPLGELLRARVLAIHHYLFTGLTAADGRVGKGYGLGRALADLCLRPAESSEAAFRADFDGRLMTLTGWLQELKSVLPDHASESVANSIEVWRQWIESEKDETIWDEASPWVDVLHPRTTLSMVTFALVTQGNRWRAILTGETRATDLLEAEHYIAAGDALLRHLKILGRKFWTQYWHWFAGALVALFAVILAALFAAGNAAGAVASLGAAAATLGITWKGVQSTLGTAVKVVETPLWGAQVDLAVASALTILPTNAPVKLEVPRERSLRLNATPRPPRLTFGR